MLSPQIEEQVEECVDILVPSSVDESASLVYNQVRQEQIAADPESVERMQQHIVE